MSLFSKLVHFGVSPPAEPRSSSLVRASSLLPSAIKSLKNLEKRKNENERQSWEGLGDSFIPDLHRLSFGFPMLEDMKYLSPLVVVVGESLRS